MQQTHNPPQLGLALLVCLALGAAAYVIGPFAPTSLLALALAVSFGPIHARLCRLFGGRRRLAAGACAGGLGLVLLLPVAAISAFVARELSAGVDWALEALNVSSLSDLPDANMPQAVQAKLAPLLARLHLDPALLRQQAGRVAEMVKPFASAAAHGSITLPAYAALMLIMFFFFLVDGGRLPPLLQDILPMSHAQSRHLLDELKNVLRATVLGSLVTAVVQSTGVGIAMALAGIPHGAFFALLALPASFIPVAGSALIWGPAAAGLLATSELARGLALAGGLAALSTVNTNFIKPMVVRGRMSMHTGLVFLSILGGIPAFGMVGLVAGPLLVASATTLLRIYRETMRGAQGSSGA